MEKDAKDLVSYKKFVLVYQCVLCILPWMINIKQHQWQQYVVAVENTKITSTIAYAQVNSYSISLYKIQMMIIFHCFFLFSFVSLQSSTGFFSAYDKHTNSKKIPNVQQCWLYVRLWMLTTRQAYWQTSPFTISSLEKLKNHLVSFRIFVLLW